MKKVIEYANDDEYISILRTLIRDKSRRLGGPNDAYNLFRAHANDPQECFMVATLNGAHEVIETTVVALGLVNRILVHPREVYRKAVTDNAAAIIVGHNHPSGNLDPSVEDLDITRRIQDAGEVLGIPLLDHVIVSSQGYHSMVERGEMVPRES